MTTVADDFTRADSTTSAGPGWTNRAYVVGIAGNAAYPTLSGAWCVASHNTAMGSDDTEASITLGAVSDIASDYAMVGIGFNEAGEGVFVDTAAYDGQYHMYSVTDWAFGGLVEQASGGGGWATGDVLKLKRVGNTYTVYLNGTSTGITWTDGGNVVPRDSGHRLVAIGSYDSYSGHRRIDAFEASDAGTAPPSEEIAAALSGAGTLTATATAKYPLAAALSGAGVLSATAKKVAPVAGALTGSGTLSAVAVARVAAALTLSATGTLAATAAVSVPQPVSASLYSTGQLHATVVGPEVPPPPYHSGWTDDPGPAPRQWGPGWATTALLPPRQTGPAWFAKLEKVAQYASAGTLSATVNTTYPYTTSAFVSAGCLTTAIAPRKTGAVAFATSGELSGTVDTIRYVTVAFSGSGSSVFAVNDGLSAVIEGGGTDGLSAIITGGVSDGLTASVVAGEQGHVQPQFIGTGALSATVTPKIPVPLSGTGTLAAAVTPRIGAALSGTGSLSGTATPRLAASASLAATGSLSATVYPVFTTSLAGAGSLSAPISPIGFIPAQQNLVTGSGFENSAEWTYYLDANNAITTDQAHSGSQSYRMTSVNNWLQLLMPNWPGGYFDYLPSGAGRKIRLSVWLRRHASNTNTSYVYIGCQARDAAGTELTHPDGQSLIAYPQTDIPNNGWKQYVVETTLPANTANFYARVLLDAGVPAGDQFYIDDVELTGNSSVPLSSNGTLSATAIRQANIPANLSGGGTLSATVINNFTPFNETNTNRTNQTRPIGCTGAYITLIGAGGGAGSGRKSTTSAAGGSGGGGGAFIPRVFVPVANLGATYSVVVATTAAAGGAVQGSTGNGFAGTAGTATTFVSGATNMSAGGGGAGLGGTSSSGTAGGAGGTVSGATGDAGTNGGATSTSAAGGAGVDNGASASGGAGGGAGGGATSIGTATAGGKGGNTNGQNGGSGGSSGSGGDGGNGSGLVAAVASSGGGGGGTGSTRCGQGGDAPGYGGGGGGSAGGGASSAGGGGNGGLGYALIEWV